MKFVCSQTSLKKFTPLLGVVALSSVAFLGGAESARAAFECGPGADWVTNCTVPPYSPFDSFQSIGTLYVDVDIDDPAMTADYIVNLSGGTNIYRGNPTGAITNPILCANDPISACVAGDGRDAIETEIYDLNLSGTLSALGTGSDGGGLDGSGITVKVGDGTPNLSSDGPLYTPGAINETAPTSATADSFFDVFGLFKIPSQNIVARNMAPIKLIGDNALCGVPPNQMDIPGCPTVSYKSQPGFKTDLFAVDPNTLEFLLDGNGQKIRVARLVPGPNGEAAESHTPVVPEPSAVLGSLFGLGAMLKLKRRRKSEV